MSVSSALQHTPSFIKQELKVCIMSFLVYKCSPKNLPCNKRDAVIRTISCFIIHSLVEQIRSNAIKDAPKKLQTDTGFWLGSHVMAVGVSAFSSSFLSEVVISLIKASKYLSS